VISSGKRRRIHPLHRAYWFPAYQGLLATSIEEKPMPVSRTECRIKRVGRLSDPAQQFDLFAGDRPRARVDTPAWPELPAETREALTGLMVRLILEHAGTSRVGSPRDISHDL